ncbi:hypothetical protein [Aulosira sp. FACHB-615]|uniref:hypothetical protein n=1 Tax=Aulosira sp. FACHB-615 TaxID=2692777 RepID=UPI001686421B|nr:hypothetical protein [Aulosira sp. FACHB-615]MBD2492358.1 hypothetical protein [Aulosira sp. FACHB-615]
MQPTISIPSDWEYPRFAFGQRTQQGIVIGLEYKPANTQLAHEYGNSWRYTVLPDKHSDEVQHYSDDQIQTLSVAEVQQQLQIEIEQYQMQIKLLQQQLVAISGGSNDG